MTCTGFFLLFTLSFFLTREEAILSCSTEMYNMGYMMIAYFGFAFTRVILSTGCIMCCSKRPKKHHDVNFYSYVFCDGILLPIGAIYSIIAVSSVPLKSSKLDNKDFNSFFNYVLIVVSVFGMIASVVCFAMWCFGFLNLIS